MANGKLSQFISSSVLKKTVMIVPSTEILHRLGRMRGVGRLVIMKVSDRTAENKYPKNVKSLRNGRSSSSEKILKTSANNHEMFIKKIAKDVKKL